MATVSEGLGVLAGGLSANTVGTRYRALIRIAQAIRGHRDPKELFELLSSELRGVLPFDGIVQFDEAANKVYWNYCGEESVEDEPEMSPEDTIPWWVYQNQKPLAIHNTEQDTRFPKMRELFQRYGIRSACAVPLNSPIFIPTKTFYSYRWLPIRSPWPPMTR
jgi:GAF domain-containing protein